MKIELTQTEIQVIQIALMTYRIQTAELIMKPSKSNPVLNLITRVELDFLSKTDLPKEITNGLEGQYSHPVS